MVARGAYPIYRAFLTCCSWTHPRLTARIGVHYDRTVAPKGGRLQSWNISHNLKRLVMRFVCFILLCFGTSTKDPIQSLDLFYLSFSSYLRCLVDYMCFHVLPHIRWKTPFQDQSVFRLLDWILHYTLFHGFDTLGSHLRKKGPLTTTEDLFACKSKRTLIWQSTVNKPLFLAPLPGNK
jgi:hypothetical protein